MKIIFYLPFCKFQSFIHFDYISCYYIIHCDKQSSEKIERATISTRVTANAVEWDSTMSDSRLVAVSFYSTMFESTFGGFRDWRIVKVANGRFVPGLHSKLFSGRFIYTMKIHAVNSRLWNDMLLTDVFVRFVWFSIAYEKRYLSRAIVRYKIELCKVARNLWFVLVWIRV